MKFFTKLINFVKKTIRTIVDMFKDKNPVEVINDTTKTVVAVATAGVAIYATVNAIRVHLIPSTKKTASSGKSAHDLMIEKREAGSIEEKFADMRRNTTNIGKKKNTSLKPEDIEVLKSIAKTRNSFFQSLSPEEQMNVLEMEEFDFKAYAATYKNNSKRPLFPWGKRIRKIGVSPVNEPFREPVDYGFFNFILRPIDDLVHWLKNDPVPKKIPQIQVVDHPEIPDVPCETAYDLIATARNLDSYLARNKSVSCEGNSVSPAAFEEQQILAEEIFRHKTLKKFKKAVNRRMAQSEYNTPNLFDLMDDDDDCGKDKKKKKKKKDKKHKKSYDGGDSFSSFDSDSEKKHKKKSMSKEDRDAESRADERAQALYKYHLEKAMNGEYDRKGYKFEL